MFLAGFVLSVYVIVCLQLCQSCRRLGLWRVELRLCGDNLAAWPLCAPNLAASCLGVFFRGEQGGWRPCAGEMGGFGEIWSKMSAGVFFEFVQVRASSCKFVQVRAALFVRISNGQNFAEMWEKMPISNSQKSSCKFVQVRASSCQFVQVRASSCECVRVGFKHFWVKMLS